MSLGKGIRGNFTGFTFNNAHSSALGLTRISGGNRYTDNLAPTMKDTTVDIPGGNGTYYFGTTFNKREFSVSFAFDHLTEEQLDRIYQLWNDKKVHELIFDEEPYKVWSAKVSGISTVKYLCFDDDEHYSSNVEGAQPSTTSNSHIVYKGEGTIKFVCFFPWARSRFAYIEYYNSANIPEWGPIEELQKLAGFDVDIQDNTPMLYFPEDTDTNQYDFTSKVYGERNSLLWTGIDWTLNQTGAVSFPSSNSYGIDEIDTDNTWNNTTDWALGSQIPSAASYGEWTTSGSSSTMKYYNCGDFDAPTRWWFDTSKGVATSSTVTLSISQESGKIYDMSFNIETWLSQEDKANGHDYSPAFIVVDMMKGTIEGYDGMQKPMGIIYNEYIEDGNFFQLPMGEGEIEVEGAVPYKVEVQYLFR